MTVATHKVATASGACTHYAAVSVDVHQDSRGNMVVLSPNVFSWLKDANGPDAWEWAECKTYREAAVAGANYALKNMTRPTGDGHLVEITKIHALLTDTSWDSVAFASCFAVWDALGVEGDNVPVWEGRKVRFPRGK